MEVQEVKEQLKNIFRQVINNDKWITIGSDENRTGRHILVKDGQTKEEAIKEFWDVEKKYFLPHYESMKRICYIVIGLFFVLPLICFAAETNGEVEFDSSPIEFVKEIPFQKELYELRAEIHQQYSYDDYKNSGSKDYGKDKADLMLLRQFESRRDIDEEFTLGSQKLYKGTVSVGGKHKSKILDPDGNRSTSLFSKYKYKRFTLNTEYARSANERSDVYTDKIKFTNEYSILDNFALKYIFSKKVNSDDFQRGVGVTYSPKIFSDALEFSADIQNRYSPDAIESHQFNFETTLHF